MNTLIEAGHYYDASGPSNLSQLGWQIGKHIHDEMPGSEMALFIDDFHAEQDIANVGEVFLSTSESSQLAESMRSQAAWIFSELAIAKTALDEIAILLDNGQAKLRKGSISSSGIRLATVDTIDLENLEPTCVMLDYLLMKKKTAIAANQVTILPNGFKGQQSQLTTLLESKLAIPGLDMQTVVLFDHNDKPEEVAERIVS